MTTTDTTLDEAAEARSKELMKTFGAALRAGSCRIEFGFAFPLNDSGTRATATIYTKNDGGRWVATKPYLAADPGEDRDVLLDMLRSIYLETRYRWLTTIPAGTTHAVNEEATSWAQSERPGALIFLCGRDGIEANTTQEDRKRCKRCEIVIEAGK